MVTAAPQDQWRLLDVQGHDTRLAQLAHRRRTLPEHAELERLQLRRRALADELVAARTEDVLIDVPERVITLGESTCVSTRSGTRV